MIRDVIGEKVRNDNRKLAEVCCMHGDVRGSGHGKLERLGWARSVGLRWHVRVCFPEISTCAVRVLSGARVRAHGRARAQSRKEINKSKSRRAAKGSASAAARKSTYKPGSS